MIEAEKKLHPGNHIPVLLENYIDFLVLFTHGSAQQVSATEFQGRKIDLVVEPKIFIKSGLIQ